MIPAEEVCRWRANVVHDHCSPCLRVLLARSVRSASRDAGDGVEASMETIAIPCEGAEDDPDRGSRDDGSVCGFDLLTSEPKAERFSNGLAIGGSERAKHSRIPFISPGSALFALRGARGV